MFFFFEKGLEILDFRRFLSPDAIKARFSEFEGAPTSVQDIQSAKIILLFATEKQQSWLVLTERSLFCVLDDRSKSLPRVRWSLENRPGKNFDIREESLTSESGRLIFEGNRRVKFSKKLFTDCRPTVRFSEMQQNLRVSLAR